MKIVAISDTHNRAEKVAIPDADILVHGGDLTMRGTEPEIERALTWLGSLRERFRAILAIPGNHDFALQEAARQADWRREFGDRGVTLLIDEPCSVDGVRFYGSPWQPWFCDWAFNFPQSDGGRMARTVWARIPDDTQILVTHGPPHGILDTTFPGDDRVGCPYLLERLKQLSALRAHVFGHIHEAYGQARRGEVLFINASTCDRERYAPVQPPIVFELETTAASAAGEPTR